ncbi:histidine kinase [Pedobacter sp. PAMC26386]|nr:histidine kinase [Pedobacter sp. PAMC26386]
MERRLLYQDVEQVFSQKKLNNTPISPVINKVKAFGIRGIALLFLLLVSSVYCYAQTTFIKHYNTKDGLPSNSCYYLIQDKKGYIWVASDAGVSRFDGKIFETFSVDDGLPDNQIIRLNEDRSGRIWFSALNGQLSYFLNGVIYNASNNKLLKLLKFNGVVTSFFEDSKGNIWFGTNKNMLARWDGKSLKKYSSTDHDNQFINTFIYEDQSGRIWASSTHCLRFFDGETFIKTTFSINPLSYKTAKNLPNRTMYFLDKKGLNFKNGMQQMLTMKIDSSLLADNPGYFYAESQQELWLTTNSGVYHLEANGSKTHYLNNVTTNQVIKDNRGNMWFTTNNGIYMLPKKSKRVYVIDNHQGLSNNIVKSVMKDHSSKLWLGLDNGKINILNRPGHQIDKIDIPNLKKFGNIKQISPDSSGKAIFFSSEYGLGILHPKDGRARHIQYVKESDNSDFVLKSFSVSSRNQLSLALSSGIVTLNNPFHQLSFTPSNYKKGENFFSNRAYRVFYDSDDNLWFSNTSGLAELSAGKLIKHYQRHPLLTKRINDIAQLPDGTIVLATDGYGILFLKNNLLIRQITREDGLANNICKKLFIQKEHVWVITNGGVNRIFLNGKNPVESFEYTNSLLDNDINDLYIDKDSAYFATNHGLVFFANTPFDRNKEVPKVLISAIVNNRKPLPINADSFNLAPADNNITFYYSALDFQNNYILYRYRLKETNTWTETRNRRLEFSSLEPGIYKFELSAKTNNSQWSQPIAVSFTLKAHFWQTWWFIFVILLIASLSFYKIAVFVTKQQKNKEQQRLLLKNKILMLEQQALQAMMNPHFVFNVMNSIQHYINTKDTSSANKILTGFARLIRKNLDICTKSFISIEEEIEYLTLYLSLEKKRFGEKFNYTIHISPDIDQDETMIPSMILQPYIENAIWHGLMPKEEGGKIEIVIQPEGTDALLIQIIDDGVGIDNSLRVKKEKHVSKGMSLTQERINLINQIEANPIQIGIKQNGKSGTTISILVPNR